MDVALGPLYCSDIYSSATRCLSITLVFRDELAAGGDAPYSPPEYGFNGWILHLDGTIPPPPVGLIDTAEAWGLKWPEPSYGELVQMQLEVKAELAAFADPCAYFRDRANDPGKPPAAQSVAQAGWAEHSRLMHLVSSYYGWLGRYRTRLRLGEL